MFPVRALGRRVLRVSLSPSISSQCVRSLSATAARKMRLVTFDDAGGVRRIGVHVDDKTIVDLSIADPTLPHDMRSFIAAGKDALTRAAAAAASGRGHVPVHSVRVRAPIYNPEKIVCIGMNYADHCHEQNFPLPEEPIIFSKFASAIVGTNDDIVHPEDTSELDFEVELVIVIGEPAHRVKAEDAYKHVFGYTVAHDVSARDWQLKKNGGQWLAGKTFDTFAPIGPCIVTASAIGDPHTLGIRCRVNGTTMQDSNTSQLIHRVPHLVAFVSRFATLKPGDLIMTGTPPGVGCFRKPPVWLKRGDTIECEIDKIGIITNTVR